jgi:MFS family permease
MVMYAETMLLPAIPDIIKDFKTNYSTSSWTLSGYLITAAVSTPVIGKLSDIYGKKKILMIVLLIFGVAILLGGFTNNISFLIFTRIMQGIGLSVFTVSLSIIRTEFPQERYGIAQTIISCSHATGSALGVGIGGYVIHYFGWHFTFILLIPVVILIFSILKLLLHLKGDQEQQKEQLKKYVVKYTADSKKDANYNDINNFVNPDDNNKNANATTTDIIGHLDIKGSITLAVTVAVFLIALSYLNTANNNNNPSTMAIPIVLIATGIISLLVFIKVERKAASPLINFKLMASKTILSVNVMFIVLETAKMMVYLTIPILIRAPFPLGFSGNAIEAGMVQNTFMLTFLVVAPFIGFIIDKYGNMKPLLVGAALSVVGYSGMVVLYTSESGIVTNLAIISAGVALISSAGWNILLRSTPLQFTGVSVGMTLVLDFIGMSIGPVVAAIYLQSHQVFLKTIISGRGYSFPSSDAYNLVFITAALLSIILVVFSIFLKKVVPSDMVRLNNKKQ